MPAYRALMRGDLALLLVVQAVQAVDHRRKVAAALPLLVIGEQLLVLAADLGGPAGRVIRAG